MLTKLFIAEGLPGSGKSTAAQIVYELLKEKGIDAELYSEGSLNHPADYDGVAFFNKHEFESLIQAYSEYKALLNGISIMVKNGYLIPYMKAVKEKQIDFSDDLFDAITKNDIYELPLELHMDLIVDRWQRFAADYASQDKVVVFECCFIQNPVTVSMIRSNASKNFAINYISRLAEAIAALNPVLIYIDQKDIRSSFAKTIPERSKQWFEGFMDYYTKQGYGLANNLSGLEGVLEILDARNELERRIFDSLMLSKYKIDNSDFNRHALKNKLETIIKSYI